MYTLFNTKKGAAKLVFSQAKDAILNRDRYVSGIKLNKFLKKEVKWKDSDN